MQFVMVACPAPPAELPTRMPRTPWTPKFAAPWLIWLIVLPVTFYLATLGQQRLARRSLEAAATPTV